METATVRALRDSIEKLYSIFAAYPLKVPMRGCSHLTPDAYAQLASKPLRQLTGDDLGEYAFDAVLTCGDEQDFRYFLPRLFELMVLGPGDGSHGGIGRTDVQTVLAKLLYAGWRTWPQVEQQTIEVFFLAWWHAILSSYPCYLNLGHVVGPNCTGDPGIFLDSLSRTQTDLSFYLNIWRQEQSVPAILHLADFVDFWVIGGGIWDRGPFDNVESTQYRQMADWLRDPQTQNSLESLFFKYMNGLLQEQGSGLVFSKLSDAIAKVQQFTEWTR